MDFSRANAVTELPVHWFQADLLLAETLPLSNIVAVVVILGSLFYFGVPLLILSTFRMNSDPRVTDFTPDKIPAKLHKSLDYFEEQQDLIEELGFEYVTNIFIRDLLPTTKMLGQVWYHTSSRTGLVLIHAYVTNAGAVTLTSQFVEFSTSFSNDVVVDTNNTKSFSPFPTPDKKIQHSLFWEKDIERVYRFHAAICDDVQLNAEPINELDDYFDGNGLRLIKAGLTKECQYNREVGYLTDSGDSAELRPTFKGAFLMTWKELPPFKQFRMYAMKKAVRRTMRDLDVRFD